MCLALPKPTTSGIAAVMAGVLAVTLLAVPRLDAVANRPLRVHWVQLTALTESAGAPNLSSPKVPFAVATTTARAHIYPAAAGTRPAVTTSTDAGGAVLSALNNFLHNAVANLWNYVVAGVGVTVVPLALWAVGAGFVTVVISEIIFDSLACAFKVQLCGASAAASTPTASATAMPKLAARSVTHRADVSRSRPQYALPIPLSPGLAGRPPRPRRQALGATPRPYAVVADQASLRHFRRTPNR